MKEPFLRRHRQFRNVCILISLITIPIGIVEIAQNISKPQTFNYSSESYNVPGAFIIGLFLVGIPVLFWMCVIVNRIFNPIIHTVMTPVPSPAEIYMALGEEWGRTPTTEEVAAVHQMLTDQKTQELLMAGITLGGIYMITHHGKN